MLPTPDRVALTLHLIPNKRWPLQSTRAKKISSLKLKILLRTCILKVNKTVKIPRELATKILLNPALSRQSKHNYPQKNIITMPRRLKAKPNCSNIIRIKFKNKRDPIFKVCTCIKKISNTCMMFWKIVSKRYRIRSTHL